MRKIHSVLLMLGVTATTLSSAHVVPAYAQASERVTFASADRNTTLVGYVFAPQRTGHSRAPAIVMMHGRAGAYSSQANDVYDASTLSRRHRAWGELWAREGYVAILVDGFGPRGHPRGFPRFSYDSRPEELNEVTVRPLDAYGALAYLRRRDDVDGDRIGLFGWSNGGSATLAAMANSSPQAAQGFLAAVAFYPACGLKGVFVDGYMPYAPVHVFMGRADEEVSPRRCARFVEQSRAQGGLIAIRLYDGASHGFDDPGRRRQSVPANAAAAEDARDRAVAFFFRHLSDGRRHP